MFLSMSRLLLLIVVLLLGSCSQNEMELKDSLRIGLLPDRDPEAIVTLYQPLLDYLSEELNLEVELVLASSYEDLRKKFTSRQIDLVNFGALTYVQAQDETPVVPLVMRDIDTRFTSYFIVHRDSAYMTLLDTQNKHLLFGSDLSTSAHVMPRSYLMKKGMKPEAYFSKVSYSGKHDATIEKIANKEADVGAVNAILYRILLEANDPRVLKTRIIRETEPYADYVWTMHQGRSSRDYQAVSQAFLSLSFNNPQHRIIMNNLGTRGFLPANDREFNDMRTMAKDLGMIGN